MNNTIIKISNGLMMLQSYPFNWIRDSIYAKSNTEPYFYHINIGGSFTCIYIEEKNELSISNLTFRVESIEEAGEIVLKLMKGMRESLEGTVHESSVDIRDKNIEKILN